MARNAPPSQVEKIEPIASPRPRRTFTLPLDQLHPVLRIAHRRLCDMTIPRRTIMDHELVLAVAGSGQVDYDGDELDIATGDLVVIPPFRPHTIHGQNLDHLAVHFDLSPRIPGRSGTPTERAPYDVVFPGGMSLPRVTRLRRDESDWQRLEAIVALRERGDAISEAEAVARLMQVVVSLLRRSVATPADESVDVRNRVRVERAAAWLRENLHRDIGVEDIADAAGLSASHLRRLFPQWTGYSPNEYLRRARVERARAMLGNVDLTLKEIATRCGFSDPFHFSKVFRQVDGLPPSRFREALLAGRLDERK